MEAKFDELKGHIRENRNDAFKETLTDEMLVAHNGWGTLLHYAALYNNGELIPYLALRGCDLETPGEKGATPLMVAVVYSKEKSARALLQVGANPKGGGARNPLRKVFSEQTACELIELFIDEIILTENKSVMAHELIMLGATLYHATCSRNIELLDVLMRHDFDINSTGNMGRTALHAAAYLGDLDTAQWLILKGIDVNVLDKQGYGAIAVAAANADVPMVKLLLANGADVNCGFRYTTTPLFLTFKTARQGASEHQYDECAEFLLLNGSVPFNPPAIPAKKFPLPQPMPQTYLDYAMRRGNNKRLRLVICKMAMYRKLDLPVCESVIASSLPEYEAKSELFRKYYTSAYNILGTKMYDVITSKKMTLMEILSVSEEQMMVLASNKFYIASILETCTSLRVNVIFPYYYNLLLKRIVRAEQMIILEDTLDSLEFSKKTKNDAAESQKKSESD